MKNHIAALLCLFFVAAGLVLAEDKTAAYLADGCKLTGPTSEASEECKALRVNFRAEVNTCMDQLRAKADAKAGMPTSNNAHTARSRFLICQAENIAKLGLASRTIEGWLSKYEACRSHGYAVSKDAPQAQLVGTTPDKELACALR